MKKTAVKSPADYIVPLNMNGLNGRMLRLPAPKKYRREILVIYGHHATLERWWGLVQNFNGYGAVTMPDLPGFGGMDSFYTIGKRATIDNFADYLASFIKLRYKRRRVTIIGMSFGFVVVTRMLQRYPEIAKRVDFLISAAGFAHHDDFSFSRGRMKAYRAITAFLELPPAALFFRYAVLNGPTLRTVYARTPRIKQKFAALYSSNYREALDMEVKLWQCNDVRTYMKTANGFLHLDNCVNRIDLPVWHVASRYDHFFDNNLVEQHLRVAFSDFQGCFIDIKAHAPSVLADKKESAVMLPPMLRRIFSQT